MSQRILIFANPVAGRGGARQLAAKLAARLKEDGWEVDLLHDPRQMEPSVAPAQAAIVIGGDGSVRSAAQCLLRNQPDGQTTPLLPVPMGTANLMGRHLGMQWTAPTLPDQVAAALKSPNVLWLDAGLANGELFLLMAGVGIDALIVHELDRMRNGPITMASYTIPAAVALGFYDYPPLTVEVDGQTLIKELPAMALVSNVSEHGVGFPFLPNARPDDGLLDVCVLPAASRAEAIALFLHVAAGEHLEAEGVRIAVGKTISITSSRPAPLQLDGEAAGFTPVEISLLPRRLPFIVMGA